MKEFFKNIENYSYKFSSNNIAILGNCLDVLKEIKDNSVDLIFADPPYGIGKDFGNKTDFF